ncbi:MAG: ribonuclease HII [Deltaproteobacteria bacterium]|nr:ribonuclease HII [Candidatus Anaeroferrophillus wilburensis]MBN2889075.1 ribonuclease HII [Deltaproteobacteria bacterium]
MTASLRGLQRCFNHLGYPLVAGVDEVGRGPLAGPVVAAAVVLPAATTLAGVKDSKALSFTRREELFHMIVSNAITYGIGVVGAVDIDRLNILQATFLAMGRAVSRMHLYPDLVVVDGCQRLPLSLCQYALVKGDARCQAVAAASILAKVVRDRIMAYYHRCYPEYGFDRHKGYGTVAHRQAVGVWGLSPVHRRTFKVKP